ncbi:hypothetical protein LTR42_000909 [Elasticomyces elasticus]|nr:hypothetical protein LTR42_000909 [Elasticomyces elasticus]
MLDDPTCLSGDQEEIELHKRGKIEVIVQRFHASKNDKAIREAKKDHLRGEEDSEEIMQLSEKTNKKVAGKQGRSHYAKHLALGPFNEPTTDEDFVMYNHKRISEDETGDEIKFTFFYTNRMYMEIQRLVPIIAYPGTRAEAFDVEEYESPALPAAPSQGTRPVAEVSFASAHHTGIDQRPIKIEDDDGEDEANEQAASDDSQMLDDPDGDEADRNELLAHIKRESMDIDDEDEPQHDDRDNDDEQIEGYNYTRERTFDDNAAYGGTPHPGSTPRSHQSANRGEALDHRSASTQFARSPVPEETLVSLFRSPSPTRRVQTASAGSTSGPSSNAVSSSNRARRDALRERLRIRQEEIAAIEAELEL